MIILNKKVGETPLEALKKYLNEHPELQGERLAYAGRLDPLASGLLLILTGDECKDRDHFQNLDKTYEFDLVLGLETDTYDVMGVLKKSKIKKPKSKIEVQKTEIENIISKFTGEIEQEYPPFSSYHVNGKPLWYWNKNRNSNKEILNFVVPKKKVKIYSLEILDAKEENLSDFIEKAVEKIKLVNGDFRQEEIISIWHKLKSQSQARSDRIRHVKFGIINSKIKIFKMKAQVSSGTYIRSLAHDIGKRLRTGALADNIHRINIGDITLDN